MRRIVGILSACVVVVAGVVLASPASAVDATATCNSVQPFTALKPQNGSYVVTASTGCQRVSWSYQGGFSTGVTVSVGGSNLAAGTDVTITPPQTVTVTSTGPSTAINLVIDSNTSGATANAQTYAITFFTPGGGGGGGGSASAISSAPAPIVQQFGMPTAGSCDDAAPADLNWGGAEWGGWSESWAEWVNGGLGGAVCTRTLTYRSTTGTWSAS